MAILRQNSQMDSCFRRNDNKGKMERKTRLELATSSLARRHSTTELLPPAGAEARNRTGDT